MKPCPTAVHVMDRKCINVRIATRYTLESHVSLSMMSELVENAMPWINRGMILHEIL